MRRFSLLFVLSAMFTLSAAFTAESMPKDTPKLNAKEVKEVVNAIKEAAADKKLPADIIAISVLPDGTITTMAKGRQIVTAKIAPEQVTAMEAVLAKSELPGVKKWLEALKKSTPATPTPPAK